MIFTLRPTRTSHLAGRHIRSSCESGAGINGAGKGLGASVPDPDNAALLKRWYPFNTPKRCP